MNLNKIGWSTFFQCHFEPYGKEGYKAGRISAEYTHMYKILTEYGELTAEVSGKFRFEGKYHRDFPTIGDWVVVSPRPEEGTATIHAVLPRKSWFSRKVSGIKSEEQILAANVDNIFLVNSLNSNFNLRRIERYLTLAWESGASPVIILTKADLCENVEEKLSQVEAIAFGVPVHVTSSVTRQGIDELEQYIKEGSTIALLGSSGVGKSTLINELAGEYLQRVQDISGTGDKGKHTTTSKQIIILKNDSILIDTPGMRELQMWDGEEGTAGAFEDIEEIAKGCRFKDCTHKSEPGCAVKQAVRDAIISKDRVENYYRLLREIKFFEARQEQMGRLTEKRNCKKTEKNEKRRKSTNGLDEYE